MRFEKLVFLLALALGLLGLAGSTLADRRATAPTLPRQQDAGRWLYRRETVSAADEPVQIAFTGDVMLGRNVSGEQGLFSGVAADLSTADLTVGNLEGVLAEPGQDPLALSQSAESGYRLDWPAKMAAELQLAGFDLLSVANNHAGDRGEAGRRATAGALQRVGITSVGSRPDEAIYRTVKGVRLAFLAVNDVASPGWPAKIGSGEASAAAVSRARRRADVVIVLVHWGQEYQTRFEPRQQELAGRWAAAGADLVIGSHPHVVRGTEVLAGMDGRSSFVAYSLGNFVFDQGEEETRQGAVLWASVDREGVQAARVQPVSTYIRPRWDEENADIGERMAPERERLTYACDEQACEQVEPPPSDADGSFFQGWIDLTGDGRPERVVKAANRVTIFQDEKPVWQSPNAWQLYDAGVGDPNDDGRFEAIVVFDKLDTRGKKAGKVASHPFLIGYRGGRYVEVWGGSAVDQPILEVEIGDVDGDGRDDLVALEKGCADQPVCDQAAVTVWRWNGWGFSLLWRGPQARLSHLSLCRSDSGRMLVCVEKEW